jgi:4-hydroxy-tetrahydrodipicolinate synthase
VHGLVPSGTTGESPTLSHDEHERVIRLCLEANDKKLPVIAGTGSNSTKEAVRLSQSAQKMGVDGVLLVNPYYNKPTSDGLYAHFKSVHDATDIPILLYNIPGRSAIDLGDDLIARLIELPRIVGVKDATGDLARVASLRQKVGKDACLLSGEDMTAIAFNAMGGHGCISVTSNIAPALCANMQNAWMEGDIMRAQSLHHQLVDLHDAMFMETSPAPAKYAASLLGLCEETVRLPLVPPGGSTKTAICKAMQALGLIEA